MAMLLSRSARARPGDTGGVLVCFTTIIVEVTLGKSSGSAVSPHASGETGDGYAHAPLVSSHRDRPPFAREPAEVLGAAAAWPGRHRVPELPSDEPPRAARLHPPGRGRAAAVRCRRGRGHPVARRQLALGGVDDA